MIEYYNHRHRKCVNKCKGDKNMLIQDLIDYKFTQTEFIVIYYLNKYELGLSELIEKTGYPRDTVNSTLKRLLDNGMIERTEGENGKYIYSVPEDKFIDFYDSASRIIDYMIANHRGMMTPNVCRILCYLIAYQAFSVADLIADGWKPAATYNSIKKLLEAGIIEKKENEFWFSRKLENISRKPDVLQHVRVATFNMNGWGDKAGFENRFKQFRPRFNRSSIWGIQELVPAAYSNFENDLKEMGFKVIYPNSYTEENKNCMITALFIADPYCDEYEPLVLGNDEVFNLRYTYGKISAWNGKKLRILNLHIPQSCDVSEERKQEIKRFWELVVEEAKACRAIDEDFILLGDLNAYVDGEEESENAEYLKRLTDILFDLFLDWDDDLDEDEEHRLPEDWGYSWYSDKGIKRRLDYIFVNYPVVYEKVFHHDMMAYPIEEGISDHKAIVVEYCRIPTDEEIEAGVRI